MALLGILLRHQLSSSFQTLHLPILLLKQISPDYLHGSSLTSLSLLSGRFPIVAFFDLLSCILLHASYTFYLFALLTSLPPPHHRPSMKIRICFAILPQPLGQCLALSRHSINI